jgi:exopolysaccharide production protein ExoY
MIGEIGLSQTSHLVRVRRLHRAHHTAVVAFDRVWIDYQPVAATNSTRHRMTGEQPQVQTPPRPHVSVDASNGHARTRVAPVPPSEQRRIVVIGAPSEIPRALEHPAVMGGRFVVDEILAIDAETDDVQDVGTQLLEMLRDHPVNAMLIAGPIGRDTIRMIADLALVNNCELLAVMPTEVLAEHDPVVVWTGDSPVIQLARIPRSGWQAAAKRIVDVVGALIALVLVAPVVAILAGLIRIESPGAPLFAHARVGYRGRRFKCLKLRTMRVGAEECLKQDPLLYEQYLQNHFKIPEDLDPRTTRLGRFLRETSLDELPQLWNVLRGEMSLVGPRPVVEDELAMYGGSADLLLSVRPGITGAWAVSGRHDVGYPQRCAIELGYVRNWRLSEDVKIAFSTIKVVTRVSWR